MSVPIELVITEGSAGDLDEIYPRMVSDFPPEELKSKEQFQQLMASGQYKLYLARRAELNNEGELEVAPNGSVVAADAPWAVNSADGRIVGYAFVYEPRAPRIAWVDYLAIDPRYRDAGFGTRFVDRLCARMRSTRVGIMLEVEPATSGDAQTLETQKRRIRFYNKLGARQLDVEYLFPVEAAPYPMLLFFRPIVKMRVLPKQHIQEMIQAAYSYIHRDVKDREAILKSFIGTAHDSKL